MRSNLLPLLALTLLCATAAADPPATAPANSHRAKILETLRAQSANRPDQGKLVDNLVNLGSDFLPDLRDTLAHPDQFVTDEDLPDPKVDPRIGVPLDNRPRELRAKILTTYRTEVLHAAIDRLDIGFDPRDTIFAYLAEKAAKPQWKGPKPLAIANPALHDILPDFVVYYQIFAKPPGRFGPPPQPPLEDHNLFFVSRKDKSVTQVTTTDDLKKFLADHMLPVREQIPARLAVQAWLTTAAQLANDGLFRFDIPAEKLTYDNKNPDAATASGTAVSDGTFGSKGHIDVTLTFDPTGKLVEAKQQTDLTPGSLIRKVRRP